MSVAALRKTGRSEFDSRSWQRFFVASEVVSNHDFMIELCYFSFVCLCSGKTEKDEISYEVLFDEPFMGGQSLR